MSPENHRLNSSITGLPKILRSFILCNGQPLGMIDVSSSQPYILSSIMNEWFFTGCSNGYNLKTIYPELYYKLINNLNINSDMYSDTSNNKSFNYYSNISNNINFSLSNINITNHSFMWCKKMTHDEIQSITRYKQSPFYNDFYTYVIKSYYERTIANPDIDFRILRDKLKHTMMFVLFENNYAHRNNNPYICMFQSVFPGVDKWILELHRIVGSDKFSYLLQRAESYLLLNVVCREFHQHYPIAPLFTIHDGILTFREYLPDLTGFVLTRLEDVTGISRWRQNNLPPD